MKKVWPYLLLILIVVLWARSATGQPEQILSEATEESPPERQVLVLDVQGPIGPATRDFVTRSLETADDRDAELVVIRLDTPGGLDASTRDIIKAILNSPVPVATYVAPEGARAASAGTYILYASHIAAMSPATNVGAATPVAIIGGSPPSAKDSPLEQAKEDDSKEDDETDRDADKTSSPDNPMERKAINDSVAYIRGLAKRRDRNEEWAERAVRDADSIPAEEALELGVIDFMADDLGDLLAKIDGMVVEVKGREHVMETSGLVIEQLEPDWRNEMLAVITSPTIAYLLLLIGVYGLILEGYNPGAIVPGVVGAICLLMALYAFQMLPVNYAGLALIVLGIILMIGEVMAPSFGALGIGGIIAMIIGSIILIDTDVPGFAVSRPLIGAIATVGSLGLMGIIAVAVKARQRPVVAGREQLLGQTGTAQDSFERDGHVYVHSERWNAITEIPVRKGQAVEVIGVKGLTLRVRPLDGLIKEHGDKTQEQDHV
jgi:membrane-bound serine protease (ClpP class)